MIPCPSCDRHLPNAAQNCPCGWRVGDRGPVPKMPAASPALPTPEESLAAWEKNKDRIESMVREFAHPGNWTREEWITHWLELRATPKSIYASRCANEALANLGYRDA